jgi:hypothetical protein
MVASESAMRENIRDYDRRPSDGNIPVPDPTALTTQLVDRTVASFREVFDVRFAELNRAIMLATTQANKIPADIDVKLSELRADVDRRVLALRELVMSQMESIRGVNAERFQAVDTRFVERDVRIEQTAQESRMSQEAALAAAKEAVSEQNKGTAQAIAKFEVSIQKQIDAMNQIMTNSNLSLEDKIADLKTRLDRGEGRDSGSAEFRTEKRLDVGSVLQAIAVLATIIGLIVVAFHKT